MLKPYEDRFPWSLDWNLLRTFMVVVEQRGVTRAADFLGLKQPTVSSALRRLEDTMGHVLIIRRSNVFEVTPAGRRLYEQASAIYGTVSQLPALMRAEEDELHGHINLSLASHVVSPHFDDVLARFGARHPRVSFAISVVESGEVLARVRQNRASLGLCLIDKWPRDIACEPFMREYFGLFCGPRHRLFGKTGLGLDDLAGEPSVSFQTEIEGGPLQSVARLRARAGLAAGARGISSNLTEIRRMIVSGIGIGALPLHVARRDVADGVLWQVPPTEGLPAVDIFLLSNPHRTQSRAELAFLEMCRDMLSDTSFQTRTYA
ncbi:MAG: LysR family transcriptional regulator [Roseicyclus sp.]